MEHYLHALEKTLKRDWNRIALSNFRGKDWTFEAFATQAEKLHIFYNACGLQKGEKVALYAANSAQWAISFLSVVTNENVIVPLLSEFRPADGTHLINHSESKILLVDKDTFKKLDMSQMPDILAAVLIDDFSLGYAKDGNIEKAFADMDAAFAGKYPDGLRPEDVKYPHDNWKDLAVINYTSGTTSAPKGVMLLSENISSSVDFAIRHIPCSSDDQIVSMLPMGHIYGLVFEFLYPISCGVHVTYLGKAPAASTLLKAVGTIRPYLVITVPLVMEKVYKSKIKPTLDKPVMKVLTAIPGIKQLLYSVIRKKLIEAFGGKVQQFIMGGAALNPEVEKMFKALKLPYTVGYGMTEAAPLIAYRYWTEYVPTSCGKYLDCVQVRIDSPDPENIPGEIQAKGRNLCAGYFKNEEATKNLFTEDGFLHTGDLGVMDKDGNVFIKGRSKNMILSANGQNIYPEEIEAVINSQDYVVESVVTERNTKLVALIYFDADAVKKAGLDEAAFAQYMENLRKTVNRLLPNYSQISSVEAVDKPFEKTPKMSIKRFLYL